MQMLIIPFTDERLGWPCFRRLQTGVRPDFLAMSHIHRHTSSSPRECLAVNHEGSPKSIFSPASYVLYVHRRALTTLLVNCITACRLQSSKPWLLLVATSAEKGNYDEPCHSFEHVNFHGAHKHVVAKEI